MLYRVIGPAGSGKTEYLMTRMGELIAAGRQCILIVPEQQTVEYESLLCDRFGDRCNLFCETLNFERLPNRIARDHGGLVAKCIDKGAACALLSIVAESLKDGLHEYRAVAGDGDFAVSLYSLFEKLKTESVTPDLLKKACADPCLSDDTALTGKLREIADIYAAYDAHFGPDLRDPRDQLTLLAQELPGKPFFVGTSVFIDGYYNFTAQEYAIIKEMIAQSDDTYVSFVTDTKRGFFAENQKAADRIKGLSHKGCTDFYTGEYKRSAKQSLRRLEAHIWDPFAKETAGDDGGISLICAQNRFDECEAAAAEILSFVRKGNRFRDIAVLAGNTDTYSGIVDSVFKRAGIPCYMSAREDLETKPLIAFLLASVSVVTENFSLQSIKRYIKTGYNSLTVSESDILLSYAEAWKIRGKGWYGDSEWMMDPEGYREGDLSKRSRAMLDIANSARGKILPQLSALRDSLTKKDLTVAEGVRALYDHLIACGADEHLRASAQRLLINGDREGSERETALWKLVMDMLDKLYGVCGDKPADANRLRSLLKIMCGVYSLGAIPAYADSVTFGDARMIRAGGRKLVIVIGAVDGEFPAGTASGTFFDRVEASKLESVGIEIADTLEKAMNSGRFTVYSAFSAPAERLVVCYPEHELSSKDELQPSAAYLAVKSMFKDVPERTIEEKDLLYSRESIASAFPDLAEGEVKDGIAQALDDHGESYLAKRPKVCDTSSRIVPREDKLLISPSSFEKYVKCPFDYFGEKVLKLSERKEIAWGSGEIGSFMHKVLQEFMESCISDGKFVLPDESEREERVRALSEELALKVLGADLLSDKRLARVYGNVLQTVDFFTKRICEEFASCKFVPCGFELGIGMGDSGIPPVRFDADGKKVYLRGTIDRVDIYEKDGLTYARIIDYKSSGKKISADILLAGMNTQMIHYLYAFCENRNALPAGVMYYSLKLDEREISGFETEEELKETVESAGKYSGLFLNDPSIIKAMDGSERFVPVVFKDSGELRPSSRLKSAEEFDELCKLVREKVVSVSKEIFDGNMDVAPNDCGISGNDPCKYCTLKPLCRYEKGLEVDDDADDAAD